MMTTHQYIEATTRQLFGSGCGTFFDLDPYERIAVLTLCRRRALFPSNMMRQCHRFAANCGLAAITERYAIEADPWDSPCTLPLVLSESAYQHIKPSRVFAWIHQGQYHLSRKAA